jgi:tryptophan synthase alpha subunit
MFSAQDVHSVVSYADTRVLHYFSCLFVIVTTVTERMPYVASAADTFIYCVSVTGVTGARTGLPDDLKEFIARIRAKVNCLTSP